MNHRLQPQSSNVIGQALLTDVSTHSLSMTVPYHASPMELYWTIFEQVADGILLIDPQGRCLDLNRQACQMLGGTREEFLTRSLQELLRHGGLPYTGFHFLEPPTEEPQIKELSLRSQDGRQLWVEIKTQQFANGYLLAFLRDITEKRGAELALQEMAENMAAAQRIAHFGSWEVKLTPDFKPLGAYLLTDECCRIFGFEPGSVEITFDAYMQLVHPADREQLIEMMNKNLQKGEGDAYEYRIIRPDGSIRYIQQQSIWLRDEHTGHPSKIIGTAHDITGRKQAECELHATEEQLRALVNISAKIVWTTNADGLVEEDSPSWRAFTGQCYTEYAGNGWLHAVHVDDRPQVVAKWHTAVTTGAEYMSEHRMWHISGEWRWTLSRAVPLRNRNGRIRSWVGMNTDITERKRAETAWRELTENMAAAQRIAHVGSWEVNLTEELQFDEPYLWSDECYRIFGFEPASFAVTNERYFRSIHPDDYERFMQTAHDDLHAGRGGSYEYRIIRPDGSIRYIHEQSIIVWDELTQRPRKLLGMSHDITTRKEAEEALRAEKERLNKIAATLPGVIYVFRQQADGGLTSIYTSPGMAGILGLNVNVEITDIVQFLDWVHPDDLPHLYAVMSPHPQRLKKQTVEYRILLPNHDMLWMESIAVPEQAADGTILWYGFITDITERKRAEEAQAKLEEQLRQAQKMETIGRLAGGIAHDFNNLLTVIQGYCDLMLAKMANDNSLRGKLEQIQKASKRASALTGQLLAFSRKQMLSPTVLDLNGLITNLQGMLERLIGEDVTLTTVLHPALWSITADPSQLEQVIMNLVVNARDAMPTGGLLTIETTNLHRDHFHLQTVLDSNLPGVLPEPYVMLAVTDTGCGMSEETQAHMFEPFFTTKEQGKGTGLGLATVYGIVKQSGGDIFVYSEPGHGSTFKIYLPANAEMSKQQIANFIPAAPVQGHETILLVEDEEMVRKLVQAALEDKGYTILEARYAGEALAIASQYPRHIDLLMTDVVMPQMSGRELAERLVLLRPDLKVLFTSGYTDDSVVRHGLLTAEVEFLPKPFSPRALALKVREVLDKERVISG